MKRTVVYTAVLLTLLLVVTRFDGHAAVSITIDGSETNQFIDGFGVNANYWSYQGDDLKPAIDLLIEQAGMTQFRVVMNNGWETNNDNADSASMNMAYYNAVYGSPELQKLWGLLGYLNQKGITNGIMLNFQGAGPAWMGGATLTPGMEDEWAEMIVSLLLYARTNQHLAFNLLAPNNEPDLGGEGMHVATAAQYVTSLHKLAQKLDTYGLSDFRLVAPDMSVTETNFMPEMMADPIVMAKLAHFGTHDYSPEGDPAVANYIRQRGFGDRGLWVTEYNVWCSNCEDGIGGTDTWTYALGTADYLLGQIKMGGSAAHVWEGYDSFYPHHHSWSFWGLLAVDSITASPKTYTPRHNFYTLQHYSRFVRPGARCINLSVGTGNLESQAFYHDARGQLSIVGINRDSNAAQLTIHLQSLPSFGSLAMYSSTATTNLAPSVVSLISNSCTITVPGMSIYTLTATNAAPVNSPLLSIQQNGASVVVSWDAAVSGYTLQRASNLVRPVTWLAVTNAVQTVGTQRVVVLPTEQNPAFFRLKGE